jgi:hypothetical protein
MTLGDAIDLFRKWSSELTLIKCQGSFSTVAFCSEGYIAYADSNVVRLADASGRAEVVLRMAEVSRFGYADSRDQSLDEKNFQECIIAFIGEIPKYRTADTISYAAYDSAR